MDHRRSEQVPGIDELRFQTRADMERGVTGHSLKSEERAKNVAAGERWLD
jgi:hypothetical protein